MAIYLVKKTEESLAKTITTDKEEISQLNNLVRQLQATIVSVVLFESLDRCEMAEVS